MEIVNALFYKGDKILREKEIGDIEIKFYTSETPNEKYRIGQKKVHGGVTSISRIELYRCLSKKEISYETHIC